MCDLRDILKEGLFFILKNNGNVTLVEINDLLKAFDVDPIEPFVVFFDYERINGKEIAIAKIATSTFPHTIIRSLRGGTVDVVEQVVDFFFECQNRTKMEREVSKSCPNEKSQPKVELPKTALEGLVEVDYNELLKYINLSQEGVEIKPVNYMNRKIVFNKGDCHVENLDRHDDNWRVICDWKELNGGRKVITIKVLHESKENREMVDESDVTDRYEFLYNSLMAQKVASMITALAVYPDLRRCIG